MSLTLKYGPHQEDGDFFCPLPRFVGELKDMTFEIICHFSTRILEINEMCISPIVRT